MASSQRNFSDLIRARWEQGLFACVGLDSEYARIPAAVREGTAVGDAIFNFNRAIVDATCDLACAYKPNDAFYAAYGMPGLLALIRTVAYIQERAPEVPVIWDAKRADIGNTNRGYAEAAFGIDGGAGAITVNADAITVHPYLGIGALQPFLDRTDKGIFVLCRTSNPEAGEFQDLAVTVGNETMPLYQWVARQVATQWNGNGNLGLVVGATYPGELAEVRRIVGDLPLLIPGIGAQGGDLEATVKAGMDSNRQGMIINSSRGIIFASSGLDYAKDARRATSDITEQINQFRRANT